MGCTSSVPNASTSNANITDKCIQYEEEYTATLTSITHPTDKNESKVLPSCDTVVEPIHLTRSHKSLIDIIQVTPDLDKVISTETNVESDSKKVDIEEDNISKLEEIIEKVIELSESGKSKVQEKFQTSNDMDGTLIDSDKQLDTESIITNNMEYIKKNYMEKVVPEEEVMSPSQSECSRVTRWEALADIAAELPASLTLDPLTGQIYALSK